MGLNTSAIGMTVVADPFRIEAKESQFFALATGGSHPAYFDPRHQKCGVIVPPLFAARYAHGPIARILRDPRVGINYDTIVHFAQSFEWLEAVHPGEVIQSRGVVDAVENYENGGLLTIAVSSTNADGEEVTRSKWSFFDRSVQLPGSGRPPRRDVDASGPDRFDSTVDIPPHQTFIYAEASGDHNRIHTDESHARKVGLPGIIVHGFLTMAYCQNAVIDALCGSDRNPLHLKSLSVKFSKPVFPGERLRFKGRCIDSPQNTRFAVTATNSEDKPVLREVVATIDEPI